MLGGAGSLVVGAGESVYLAYESGNRDDEIFDQPFRFDVTRDPNRHLGFGGGGPHYCMGSALARVQLHAIFGEMLRVIPDIERVVITCPGPAHENAERTWLFFPGRMAPAQRHLAQLAA